MRKKIRNSLSAKVFLWVFFALTICSVVIYGILLTVLPRQYQVVSDRQLDFNIEILVSKLQHMCYEDAVKEINNFCIQNNAAAILSDEQETVNLGEIEQDAVSLGEIGQETVSFGKIEMEAMVVATSSVTTTVSFSDRSTEYTLLISSLSQTADTILNLMVRFLPVLFAIILLLSSVSALICSKVIVSPIAEISRISRQMTFLDPTWKCDIKSGDEIGVLASSLNTMAGRLQKVMEELQAANHQLTDDMEKCKALEEQRRNFFAAVSHELKTPLTILKGQIENMILGYGDYQNHKKYLPEALKATEDIEHLVKEIIALSKMETMDIAGTLQEVSLEQTINQMVQAVLPLARDKDIQIHRKFHTDCTLLLHPNLWEKALSNIIGNALRHSPCGAQVFITLQPGKTGDILVIENTGTHIPKEDLAYLFTPFYRADKSRNKATGGSGLGLYIVKTIFDLHGMACRIKNTEQGVAFILEQNKK